MIETILLIIFSIFFFWLSWKKSDIAIIIIIITLPSYLVRFKIFFIPTTLLEVMILLLFIAWVIRKVITGLPEKIYFSRFRWPALLFLLAAILAVFISPDTKSALGIFKAYFLEALIFFFIFINTINSSRQIKLVIWAMGISALFVSFIALWQYIEIFPSYEPWIFESPRRVTSVFDYPNAVGLYLTPICVIFLGILLLPRPAAKSKNEKIEKSAKRFFIGVIFFSLLGIVLSFSRGAIIGILAGVIFFSIFSRFRKRIWATLIIFILLVLIIPQTRAVFLDIITFQDVSTNVRTVLWQGTWNLLKDRPLQGAGLAGFPILYDQYRLIKHTELLLYPHNVVLNFWTELGLAGLVIFIWIVIKFFQLGAKLKESCISFKPLPAFNLSLVLIGAMIAILAYGLVDVPYFKNDLSVFFWFLIGMMVVNNVIIQSLQKPENKL